MNEIKNAQRIVEESRMQIDQAVSELEGRFSFTQKKVRDSIESLRQIPAQFSKDESPLATFGIFLISGYLLGSWIVEGRAHRVGPTQR